MTKDQVDQQFQVGLVAFTGVAAFVGFGSKFELAPCDDFARFAVWIFAFVVCVAGVVLYLYTEYGRYSWLVPVSFGILSVVACIANMLMQDNILLAFVATASATLTSQVIVGNAFKLPFTS